jgi:hypothetical protein
MARFDPPQEYESLYGVHPIAILDIKAKERTQLGHDWDLNWEIQVMPKGAAHSKVVQMYVKIDRSPEDGTLISCGALTKLNRFLKAIGYTGGFNVFGVWEGQDEKPLPDDLDPETDVVRHIVQTFGMGAYPFATLFCDTTYVKQDQSQGIKNSAVDRIWNWDEQSESSKLKTKEEIYGYVKFLIQKQVGNFANYKSNPADGIVFTVAEQTGKAGGHVTKPAASSPGSVSGGVKEV